MSEIWWATYVLLWLVVMIQGFLLLGALRHLGLVQLRLGADPGALITTEGIERGANAPMVDAIDVLTGQTRAIADYRGGRVAIVFLSPTCLSCKQLIPHLNAVYSDRRGDTDFLVVCNGTRRTSAEFARMWRIAPPVVSDADRRIASMFETTSTPFAFLLNEDGRVLIRGIVNDWVQLDALLEEQGTYRPDFQSSPPSEAEPESGLVGTEMQR